MVAFGSPGPITTRCPNLVPGSSCTSSFRPRPILTFISSSLNIDRRPAGTEPCARTQMPAGRLKELIVSFCGGSDPHCHRWQRTYYTIFLRTGLRPAAPESNRSWRRPFRFSGSKPREFSRRSSWQGCRFRRLATGRSVVPQHGACNWSSDYPTFPLKPCTVGQRLARRLTPCRRSFLPTVLDMALVRGTVVSRTGSHPTAARRLEITIVEIGNPGFWPKLPFRLKQDASPRRRRGAEDRPAVQRARLMPAAQSSSAHVPGRTSRSKCMWLPDGASAGVLRPGDAWK